MIISCPILATGTVTSSLYSRELWEQDVVPFPTNCAVIMAALVNVLCIKLVSGQMGWFRCNYSRFVNNLLTPIKKLSSDDAAIRNASSHSAVQKMRLLFIACSCLRACWVPDIVIQRDAVTSRSANCSGAFNRKLHCYSLYNLWQCHDVIVKSSS